MELAEEIFEERRSKVRFPVQLSVRYRTLSGPWSWGSGQTVNISSAGLLIAGKEPLVIAGAQLLVVVDWPLLLHGLTPIQLNATCQVVRRQEALFAVRLVRYQFRTRKTKGVNLRQLAAGA
ncbi:MAG TPA: PilZ domain-containing protein [Bryobacteraceae bacterium]|nr:PilZ domain-containing protein [Bryobacteraceae bacterium]